MPDSVTSHVHESAIYVAGQWRRSVGDSTYETVNPAWPDEIVGRHQACTQADVDQALEAATAVAHDWGALPAPQRGAILDRAAQALDARAERVANDMTAEMGKPLREASAEVTRGAQILRYFAGEALRAQGERFHQSFTRGTVTTLRRPVGVVGLITPWNFPLAIPLWKLAPALVHGNACVVKLAWEAPRTGLHVAECFEEAGIPPGVVNVLTGAGSVGAELVRDPRTSAISFTGSVPVGREIRDRATSAGKRVQLELGGHSPLIVMDDADLGPAVEAAFMGAFFSAGQKCTATRRIFVADPIYDTFRTRLIARMDRARIGDPRDPATEVGPLVSERQRDDVVRAIDLARADGAALVAGGHAFAQPGFFVAPTLFEDVPAGSEIARDEVFGPVTALFRFTDLDEALDRANDSEYGLAAGIFTSSLAASRRFVERVKAGVLHVNSQTAGAEVHVPFGGLKSSGFGPHEQGRASLEFYTDVVTVYEDD